jgi:hypothetical protein
MQFRPRLVTLTPLVVTMPVLHSSRRKTTGSLNTDASAGMTKLVTRAIEPLFSPNN